jgi:mono/diheme cytochrome c family protein
MPPDQPLSLEQRTIIHVWIAQGAGNTSCDTSSGGNGGNDEICFVQDILPIFLSGCGITECHDEESHQEGYVLISYETIMEKGIEPFDPGDSEIFEAVTETGDDRMPPEPRPPLTSEQIAALQTWISDGAPNNDCPDSQCDTIGTISFSSQVNPIIRGNCIGCHNSTQANGGVILEGYAQVAAYAQTLRNGTPVLLGVIKRLSGFQPMPPGFSLSTCDISKIELWIEQGAVNN